MAKLAIGDFSKEDCFKPGTSSWLSIRSNICHALEELGCFVALLPEKISPKVDSTLFGTFDELFEFPTETKVQSGYEKPYSTGYIKTQIFPYYESVGIAAATNPEQTRKFERHFWPSGNDLFRESANLFAKVMEELHNVITGMVFENYGVEKYLDDHLQSTVHTFRFNKYGVPENTGNIVGIPVHTDVEL